MKILKGVLLYTLIIIGMFLVVGMLIFGIMFITANTNTPFSLFDYKAINASNKTYDDVFLDASQLTDGQTVTINIYANDFDVNITQTSDTTDKIIARKNDNMFGLYSGSYVGIPTVTFNAETTTYKIVANEINGLIAFRDSSLNVMVPSVDNFIYNFNIYNTTGNVSINGCVKEEVAQLQINNLYVETTKGDFVIDNIANKTGINNVGFISLNSISVKTNGGIYDFSKIENLGVAGNSGIFIQAEYGDFVFDNVKGQLNILGEDIRIEANVVNTLGEGFYFNSPKGYFKITEIRSEEENSINTIITDNIDVDIETITGETTILTTYGNINVDTLNNNASLTSENGNITVKHALNNISVVSTYGNIVVEDYRAKGYIKNINGTINITFGLNVATAANNCEIISTSGSVVANNIYNPIKVTTLGKAGVTINFADIVNDKNIEHNIKLNSGTANLYLKSNRAFYLNATGNVAGNVGSETITATTTDVVVLSEDDSAGQNLSKIKLDAGSGQIIFHTIY